MRITPLYPITVTLAQLSIRGNPPYSLIKKNQLSKILISRHDCYIFGNLGDKESSWSGLKIMSY